jgi:hypothetical protein
VDFQQINAVLLANGNLHGYVLGHLAISQNSRDGSSANRAGLDYTTASRFSIIAVSKF